MSAMSCVIVRPRVISPVTGDAILLEDVVATHVSAGDHGVVEVVGGPLTGKTTAIEYLHRHFADEANLLLLDEHARLPNRPMTRRGITVSTVPTEFGSLGSYRLAPWGQDEWIEYLLAVHKSRCSSVMGRLSAASDFGCLRGNPCLWRMVLDELAGNDFLRSATETLRRVVDQRFSANELHGPIRNFALMAEIPLGDELDRASRALAELSIERPLLRLLTLESVRSILAAEALVSHLVTDADLNYLRRRLPYSLVREASIAVTANAFLQQKLRDLLVGEDTSVQPMAASLLHASDVGWKPARRPSIESANDGNAQQPLPDLSNAYLDKAAWPRIDLRGAQLSGATMEDANLEDVSLDRANVKLATLSGVKLRGASLEQLRGRRAVFARADLSYARAPNAILSRADLRDANLEGAQLSRAFLAGSQLNGARLVRANLSRALLIRADIAGADFTQANLEGSRLSGLDLRIACFDFAIFAAAQLVGCNLEAMELSGADFRRADLRRALLTGSVMSDAMLGGADLRGAGLAEVEWEGVDLRNADLRGASFHLGSTRSGLVGSPYPSHGTRTGFYTDDYDEQDFKSPEEIRKANLRGADLRRANIEGVDFYLVDVRDAHYDDAQEVHLRQCGAILKTRAV